MIQTIIPGWTPKIKIKSDRPLFLYDFDNVPDMDNQTYTDEHPEVNENEIISAIKEFSDTDYTNEMIEKNLKAKQSAASLNSKETYADNSFLFVKTDCNSSNVNVEANDKTSMSVIELDGQEYIETEANILKRCKLNKNAAFIGLLKTNKISLSDLQVPNDSNYTKHNSDTSAQNESVSTTSDLTEGKYNMKLVQCPEDPEVFVQPLQAYGHLDENKYKDINFSVPHLGKKKIVTPRQYYVSLDESSLDFVRRDVKKKT
ncbi:uncharacterized protein LOC122404665 isoform X2 [Colletes gigas]|uniref:uncharacterized protein LOC122404665 isoform X2 n=1 Tax=Colletes gigas TaxID=935657 RepID=UPI001C9AEC03|nr:uncharacterized protein LOC122404665 isoform X2 [Colletes gigas]